MIGKNGIWFEWPVLQYSCHLVQVEIRTGPWMVALKSGYCLDRVPLT